MNSRYLAIHYLPVFFVLFLPLQTLSAECRPVGQLLSLDGRVERKMHGHEEWQRAQLNENICVGDSLRTRHNSRLAVRLANDTLVRLDADSSLTFTQVSRESPSFLDLIFGAVHFISRTPKNLEVRTRYVNAMIEGTEFVVRVKQGAAEVTVLEGTVIASNEAGTVELGASQTARADAGQAPVRVVEVKPDDAVAWALYYPPLPVTPGAADKLAQACVVAIVRNRLDEAAELAQQALAADNRSAAAYMARSYLNQAGFDIPAALDDIERAAELAPQSPLVQARLAEVRMMSGDLRGARRVAEETLKRNPDDSLLHSVLGFASLREVDLKASEASFTAAIEYDSSSPLPRLGLGLVKIRQGQLESGREEIETAVLLDPNKALLRSYLGKAYYEEKRDSLAFDQLAMAKELDPNDPTAWYYESILLQSVNRPVEALQAQQKAIALNDNRGVYRSRQLLDQDEAARSVSLGRIYNDLNFEQQARIQATNALLLDPANHSAHRLLADSYAGIANLDAARQSELLQSKLTQPLNLDPLQPQLSSANLGLLDGNGPGDLSYNEYNPLFTRNGLALQLDATVGEENTRGDDLILAGLKDRLAFSVGQYHKRTDLVAAANGYRQDIVNGFLQYQLGENSSIQFEASRVEEEKGDVTRRLLPEFLNVSDLQIETEVSTLRLGYAGLLTPGTRLLVSAIRRDLDFFSDRRNSPVYIQQDDLDKKISLYETQVVGGQGKVSWVAGVSHQAENSDGATTFTYLPPFNFSDVYPAKEDFYQTRAYGYLFYDMGPSFSLLGGLTSLREKIESGGESDEQKKFYPKVGVRLAPVSGHEIRLAAFRNRSTVLPISLYETLEPTHIVGFNQLYDDMEMTDSWSYGASYDITFSSNLHAGASTVFRKLITEVVVTDTLTYISSVQDLEYDDRYANLWLNWAYVPHWSLGIDYSSNRFDYKKGIQSASSSVLVPDNILDLKTRELTASLGYFHSSGLIGKVSATYYDQDGEFMASDGLTRQHGADEGTIVDISMGYRFPNRKGVITVGVKNVFDNNMSYEDRSSYDAIDSTFSASPSSFSNERLLYGEFSITFR